MIGFVNAKINIGLQIVRRREDGYHDLHTVFYPIGLCAGTPLNPVPFCDILEITPADKEGLSFEFSGRKIDCPEEKNLVCKAARLFMAAKGEELTAALDAPGVTARLDKHLPDGAGMGGGSADASFTLRMLNDMLPSAVRLSRYELADMALRLGADCPFFIYNEPMLGEGVGERLTPVLLDLSGYWLVAVKPRVYVSTREAFSGVTPREDGFDLRGLAEIPVNEWDGLAVNDFETSVFPLHPELKEIKEFMTASGAAYASMTGSGSSIFGLFANEESAAKAARGFDGDTTIEQVYLLKL